MRTFRSNIVPIALATLALGGALGVLLEGNRREGAYRKEATRMSEEATVYSDAVRPILTANAEKVSATETALAEELRATGTAWAVGPRLTIIAGYSTLTPPLEGFEGTISPTSTLVPPGFSPERR